MLTLPLAIIVVLVLLLAGGLVAGLWGALAGPEPVRDMASKLVVVQLPLLAAMIAAIGVRRSSSREIDRLVTRFLDVAVLDRLAIACKDHARTAYPFSAVTLDTPSRGRSYAHFKLDWAAGQHRPARVGVKMNIFNIEILGELELEFPAPAGPAPAAATYIINDKNLSELTQNDVLQRFQGVIQGSVAEGYTVRLSLKTDGPRRGRMHISLRQKLDQNILSSPFLKRYFAEDISIAIGVLFHEWHQSGLATPPVRHDA